MKKIGTRTARLLVALSVALLLVISLIGCGGQSGGGEEDNGAQSSGGETSGSETSGDAANSDVPATIAGISTGEHKVIATVNGEDIYEDVFMRWYLETTALNYGINIAQTEVDPQLEEYINGDKIARLGDYVNQIVLYQAAAKEGVAITDEMVDEYLETMATSNGFDRAGFITFMSDNIGFTEEGLRRYMKEGMAIPELYERKTQQITAAESPEEYYNANPDRFKVSESRTVRHILVAERSEAEEIIRALDEGADFSELAMEKSTDPSVNSNGGVIGPFDPDGVYLDGSGSLVAPFTEASYALENVGDYTKEPVPSDFGFHVIILDEAQPARTQSFDEVEADLTEELLWQEKDSYFDGFFQELVDAATVTYAEGYDPSSAN
ncbi:MAG: peptidyl-prolyl cis-trans isomerase [Peptococcaceae bacterium]|jgi:parvulin-like peptidyl-prolyl isomerase|nr:peptidyl-prolyl cis-trans isomerase [Peptococcaceae bacterium]